MDKKVINKIMLEKKNNKNLESKNSKTTKEDISENFFLSSETNKKTKLENDKLKYMNSASNINLTKKRKSQIENNSQFLSDSIYTNKKIKINTKKTQQKENKKIFDKIIVDNMENIYQNISKFPNKLLKQRILLYLICFYTSCVHWLFLFLTKRKIERDYCLTKLNQFEACIPEQYCSSNVISKINFHFYNDSFIIHNNSLSKSQIFLKEMNAINDFYKEFILHYNYLLSKSGLMYLTKINEISIDKYNYVIILSKKEKWNIFLYFNSFCDKDMYYFDILGMIISGGFLGSYIIGILADVYGRKKLIIVTLFFVTLSFVSITIICILMEKKKYYLIEEFNKTYISAKNNTNYKILSGLYWQLNTNNNFRSFSVCFLIFIFILCFNLRPLSKAVLSLLLENCTSEIQVLQNYTTFTFISNAIPPFVISHILVLLNNFIYVLLFYSISFFILFISSFFVLSESLRYFYEYCEWIELTNGIINLYSINDKVSINFKNKIDLEAFQMEENKSILKNIIYMNEHEDHHKKNFKNTIYKILQKRIRSINRDIRRNREFIIKKIDVKINPFIIYSCIKSNSQYNNSKYLFLIILFIIYFQEYLVERELVEEPFFGLSDLYFEFGNNIVVNSNFFILIIVIYFSNYIFYLFYRISCVKIILFFSIIIITFLFILYHFIFDESYEFPVYLNQYNFKTFQIPHIRENKYKSHILLFFIVFFLNGITFYINLIFIKISKTLYRCTFFRINTILFLAGMGFGDMLIFQVKHYFILVGSLNFIGIVVVIFLGEFKNIPFIINDLKKIVVKSKIE